MGISTEIILGAILGNKSEIVILVIICALIIFVKWFQEIQNKLDSLH